MTEKRSFILSCIDGSTISEAVVDYASWLAATSQSPLKLLHTIEPGSQVGQTNLSGAIGLGARDDLMQQLSLIEAQRSRLLIQQGKAMLKNAQERAGKMGAGDIALCQRHGELAENLIDLESKIHLVVVGIKGESHEKEVGISTKLESLIRAIHKPIFVVNGPFKPPKKLLFAYDHSDACQRALSLFISLQLFAESRCHLVHVGHEGQAFLQGAAKMLHEAGIDTCVAQIEGKIDEALSQYQIEHHIDLMVMGAFSHGRMRNLLMGSFTAKMLHKTQRPLLLLR